MSTLSNKSLRNVTETCLHQTSYPHTCNCSFRAPSSRFSFSSLAFFSASTVCCNRLLSCFYTVNQSHPSIFYNITSITANYSVNNQRWFNQIFKSLKSSQFMIAVAVNKVINYILQASYHEMYTLHVNAVSNKFASF